MTPLITLTAIAAGLVLVGTGALRQRDFPTT
jgi:putative exporter of polyketide antibiotics